MDSQGEDMGALKVNSRSNGFAFARKRLSQSKALYLMILLPVVYFIVWQYLPMFGIQIAFKDYSPVLGITGSPWAGFEHFERFFNSFYFWRLLKNTLGISFYTILVGIPLPVILAIMFNEIRNKKFKSVAQTISYAPNFISIVVASGILLFFFQPETGIINALRKQLGMHSINFLGGPDSFWHIIVWSDMWQAVGWGSLIYTAAISGISPEQYEAAYVDGANKFKRIWHITLPNLLPTITIITILSLGNVMTVGFEKILLLQNPLNADASDVISTYVYTSGIVHAEYSFSSAVGLFNNAVNFIMLITANIVARKTSETSLW